jgi:hypothetical protein
VSEDLQGEAGVLIGSNCNIEESDFRNGWGMDVKAERMGDVKAKGVFKG